MRYFTSLILEPQLPETYRVKFSTFLKNNAEVLWRNGFNKKNMLAGPNWASKVGTTTQLTSQTSACTLVEMMQLYEREAKP